MEIFFQDLFYKFNYSFVQVQYPWEFLSVNFNSPFKELISDHHQLLISNTQQANIKFKKG